MFGVLPSGRLKDAISDRFIFRFLEEGNVVESWDSLDQLGMLRQLGASVGLQ
jgi:hypothetical protein